MKIRISLVLIEELALATTKAFSGGSLKIEESQKQIFGISWNFASRCSFERLCIKGGFALRNLLPRCLFIFDTLAAVLQHFTWYAFYNFNSCLRRFEITFQGPFLFLILSLRFYSTLRKLRFSLGPKWRPKSTKGIQKCSKNFFGRKSDAVFRFRVPFCFPVAPFWSILAPFWLIFRSVLPPFCRRKRKRRDKRNVAA